MVDGTITRFWQRSKLETVRSARKGKVLSALQAEEARIMANYEELQEAYKGVTPKGKGEKGTKAYLKDIKDIDKRMRDVLRSKV
jgi:hypothetical protein